MPALNQSNLLTRHEIYTRTELWKDKIYYISNHPYKFPKNNGQGDFLPLPQRFASILTEFKEAVQKQKADERPESERAEAQQRINEIYQEIKEIIQKVIEKVENYQIEIDEDDLQELTKTQEKVQQVIKDIQQFFKSELALVKEMPTERFYKEKDLTPFLKETSFKKFKEWENKWGTITKEEEESDSEDGDTVYFDDKTYREIDLLAKWEELNEGQPPLKKEELKDYLLKEREKERQEYLKKLKLGLNKKTVNQLRTFNAEHLDNHEKIGELLNEWEEQRKILLDRKNIAFILEDNDQYLTFTFQPPKKIFVNLKDFLFYRNNIWYEVESWERINHENAIITAQRSFFIHNYSQFFSRGGNGVLHHSPKFKNKDEICQCPAFLESTEFADFYSDWQPSYKLFKLKNFLGGTWQTKLTNKPYGVLKEYPVFHTLDLEEVHGMETKGLYPTTYYLLPDWYQIGHMTGLKTFDIKFVSSSNQTPLQKWVENAKMERLGHDGKGGKYEHLLKHVHVNYFWNSKKIHESTLDEIDWNHFKVVVRANPAGIMYLFQSQKVFFRYSEDLKFHLEADEMARAAAKQGASILDGFVKKITFGLVDPGTKDTTAEIGKTADNYLHGGDDNDKSKDERQGERKKTLAAATGDIMQSVIGSIPSLLDASHTHGDYSLAEIALRFNTIQFKIRLEFNKNLSHRYQMMKSALKKPGNEVFNTEKIGNIFSKGYMKIVPNIFEGDKNGFFAGLLSRGVYFYKENPHEYFLEKGEKGTFKRGIVNDDPVMTNTTIQVNHKSAIGRDNLVHVDDMSWVWKDSYLRPVDGGTDLFPQLINQGRHKLKVDDGSAWKFDGYASWSGSVTLPKNVKYEWYMHAFSSGEKDNKNFRGVDDNITVKISQDGADWSLDIYGKVEITETIGNPDAIGGGTEIDDLEEILPDLEDEKQTEGLDNLEQNMEPESEEQKQQEIQDELEPEPEAQKQDEKQEELEPEDEKTKEKTKEKQKQKQKEDEFQNDPENSREGEK